MEGSSIRESEGPWLLNSSQGVHGIKVQRCILLGLSSGKEDDSWKCWDNGSREGSYGQPGDLLVGGSVGAAGSWGNHVWLKKETLDEEVLLEKLLHDGRENSLGNISANLDGVITILEDFWLDNWSKSILLADRSVPGKGVSGLSNSSLRWAAFAVDLEDGSPFSESASQFVIFSASSTKSIKTLGGCLSIGSSDNLETSVDLDTAVNSSSSKDIAELLITSSVGVLDGLVEHDDSTDVLLNIWGGEKEFSVGLSVSVVVLNTNAVESLSNGSGRLIGGEDSLTWGANFLAGLDQFFFEGSTSVSVHLYFLIY